MRKPTYVSLDQFYLIKILNKIDTIINCKQQKFLPAVSLIVLLLCSTTLFAQLAVPFSPRLPGGSIKVKGDVLHIGNNIVTAKDLPLPYNGDDTNNNNEGVYINVEHGGDSSIFSSSSADLFINNSCKKILYAGLYWASVYPLEVANNRRVQFEGTPRLEDWNQVKFKVPGGNFIDLVADTDTDNIGEEDDIIFDGFEHFGNGVENSFKDSPIICYKNVTQILQELPDADGKYTLANLRATRGNREGGCSAGWTMVVIYESPLLPSKFISVFDGYAGVQKSVELNIPVSGFQTLPAPLPVKADICVSALEGDRGIHGDSFQFKASTSGSYTILSDPLNDANNFFNSTITLDGAHVTNRNPASLNTLGLDINNFRLPNPANSVLPNDAAAGELKLTTNGDGYGIFVTSFSVEIIEPDITLTKIVENEFGTNIGNDEVNLGDELNYVLGFQNNGNDDAKNLTIRDILPINIVFDYPSDVQDLPAGVTVQSYDPITRELIFSVDDSIVEENDPVQEIRFKVTVVSDCSLLTDACSNIVSNQAYVTYNGTINSEFAISDDPSFSTNSGCLITPGVTNFLANLDCTYDQSVILCGDSTLLTAANGYDTYTWSSSPTGMPIIATGQSLSVNTAGTFYVYNAAVAPCQSITQEFEVTLFGEDNSNPIIPFADEVVICPNDGKELPNIFLCGANDVREIQTGIRNVSSMIWEILDSSSCTAVLNQDCANESNTCTWNQVGTGPSFNANMYGQYRLTLNYNGGCFNQYYFNVYENELEPNVISRNIVCTTPGEITVGGVPNGYEYSIDNLNYQLSNIFPISVAGIYSIYIRQIGVATNPCVFTVPDVQIRNRDFEVETTVQQPLCFGDLGTIILAANDARPQYFFSIFQGATLINSVGPIATDNYSFTNLNPGIYTVNISTEDGCTYTGDITIVEPPILEVTSALTQPLTCTNGEITVYPTGGTPPYFYFVNGSSIFQSMPSIDVPSAGNYTIRVVDFNNCEVETSISVDTVLQPEFSISKTDILCADAFNSGAIAINVVNPNGNTLRYSVDGGTIFQNSPNFTNLIAENYIIVVEYGVGTDVCTTNPETVSIETLREVSGTVMLSAPYTCTSSGTITVSNVNGGVPPYQYSIDGFNYQSGNIFSGLTSGSYTVTVRDANVCTFNASPITISALNPPSDMEFTNTPINCSTNTTDVSVTTFDGATPLQYRITAPSVASTAYQTSNTFAGLTPGTYTFQVLDANACTYLETYSINPLPSLTVATVITKALDCTVSPEGIITGTITGGTSPFTYAVAVNGGSYNNVATTTASFIFTAPINGDYQFQITDANNCVVESGVQTINAISLPDIITVAQTQSNLCNGDLNAAINITIDNTTGTPPFVININNDTTGVNYGTQTSGLPAGNYTITLTDANECVDSEAITITEPTPINVSHTAIPITCDVGGGGISKGSVIIQNVTGGTAPYSYYVTGTNGYADSELNASGTTSTTFDVVDFGWYQINVVDANGCSVLVQNILVASPPNDLDIAINTVVDCATGGSATVSIGTALASAGPFFFDIYRGVTPPLPPSGTWVAEDTPGSQTATFTGLIPGITYTFIVFDGSTGCSYYETASASVPTNSTLTASALSSNNITCIGNADGNTSFSINSVYSVPTTVNYEILDALSLISTGISGTGVVPATGTLTVNNFGPLPFGSYMVSIMETVGPNVGCGIVTAPFNITESVVDLNITATVDKNANCNINSGFISAIARDGTPPYQYQLTSTPAAPLAMDVAWASGNTFNVDANTYYVHVKDAYNCIKTSPALIVPQDSEPTIVASINNECTATQGNFEVEVTLSSIGSAPYSFSIDGGAFQRRSVPFTISNLASGVHSIQILDANSCGNTISIVIAPPISITPAVNTIPSCNNDDGEIAIAATGGTGVYTYTIQPNPTSASLNGNVFSGLPSGNYVVTVTDANTCFAEASVVLPKTILPVISTLPTPVNCFGDNTGSFTLQVDNYSGSYTYEVLDASANSLFGAVNANTATNPIIVSSIPSGSYSVVLNQTSSPFCTVTSNVIISSPPAALVVSVEETSNVSCDNNLGTITANAIGGWGSYEYELTGATTRGFSSNSTFTDLEAGTYTVNVRDGSTCIVSETIVLNIPDPIEATISLNSPVLSCFGDKNGVIAITSVVGGQGSNYTYTLNQLLPVPTISGPQTSTIFNNLSVGTYTVTVTDGYNCEFTTPTVVINQPTKVEANLFKAQSQTCTTDARLTLSATGGNAPYEYSSERNFTSVLGSFTTNISFNVKPDSYQYFVRDANGCITSVSNEIYVDELPALTIQLEAMNSAINCTGDSTGVIITKANGGLGNYLYTLQDTSGNTVSATQNSPGIFTDLPAGNYQVRVESDDCFAATAAISITQPLLPLEIAVEVSDVSCTGENNGSIEIIATGGTGTIKYAISPQLNQFFNASIFENLAPGSYQVVIQDELGCLEIIDVTINEPAPVFLTVVPNSMIPELCFGELNGAFSVEISGGSLPYSVSVDDFDGVYTVGSTTQSVFNFTELSGGNHIVYIRDNENCEAEFEIDFPQAIQFNPELVIDYSCVGNATSNTVTVQLNENDTIDSSELEYALNGTQYQASNTFTNIASGLDHYINVKHINGCVVRTESFDIDDYVPLALTLQEGGGLNEIEAIVTGGTGNYEFTLNGESMGNATTFIISESGTYTVTVIDRNGCSVSASIPLEFINICISNYFVPNDGGWGPGCTQQYRDLTFDIFDRYGRKIVTLNVDDKWDGKYKGKDLPTGDYWYVVNLNNNTKDNSFVGHFTLYR